MKRIALLLAMLLLVPSATALTTLHVTSTGRTEQLIEQPFSDVYGFSLDPIVFDDPVYRASVGLGFDFGTVSHNYVIHVTTDWRLRGEHEYYTNVSYRSFGEKTWYGLSYFNTKVFVNGTLAWAPVSTTAGVAGAHFDYEQTHFIQYAENVTALVPYDDNGDPIWDWAVAGDGNTVSAPGGRPAKHVTGLNGWFFVAEGDAEVASRHDNASTENWAPTTYMWLSNDTHVTEMSATTYYQDRIPETLLISYEFDKELSFFADVAAQEDCGGIARMFMTLVGVCPTLSKVVAWSISFVPNVLSYFLGFVSPEAAGALQLAGEIAGEFVAALVFTSSLLMLAPGKLFFVLAATVSGAVNLAAGMRGDLANLLQWNFTAMKWLILGVFWYFYLYWLLMKFAVETIIKVVDTIGGYIPFT